MSKVISAGPVSLVTDLSALIALATATNESGKTLQSQYHLVLLSAVYHADSHKNSTPLLDFLNDIPAGVNRGFMLQWLETFTQYDYSPAREATGNKAAKVAKIHKVPSRVALCFVASSARDDAANTPYYALKQKQADKKDFDLSAFIDRFLTSLDKKRDEFSGEQLATISSRLLSASNGFAPLIVPTVEASESAPGVEVPAALVTASRKSRKAVQSATVSH